MTTSTLLEDGSSPDLVVLPSQAQHQLDEAQPPPASTPKPPTVPYTRARRPLLSSDLGAILRLGPLLPKIQRSSEGERVDSTCLLFSPPPSLLPPRASELPPHGYPSSIPLDFIRLHLACASIVGSPIPLRDFLRYPVFPKPYPTWPPTIDGDVKIPIALNWYATDGSLEGLSCYGDDVAVGAVEMVCNYTEHQFSTVGSPTSIQIAFEDAKAVAEYALKTRHAQSYADGNHRTSILYLFLILCTAGYDTRDLDPLLLYLAIAPSRPLANETTTIIEPGEDDPTILPLAKLIIKHVRRGAMSEEAQEVVAERVKALPVVVSLLFFMKAWLGVQPVGRKCPSSDSWIAPGKGAFKEWLQKYRRFNMTPEGRRVYQLMKRLSPRTKVYWFVLDFGFDSTRPSSSFRLFRSFC